MKWRTKIIKSIFALSLWMTCSHLLYADTFETQPGFSLVGNSTDSLIKHDIFSKLQSLGVSRHF